MNGIDLRKLTEEEFTQLTQDVAAASERRHILATTQAQVVDLLSKYLEAGGDPAALSDTPPAS